MSETTIETGGQRAWQFVVRYKLGHAAFVLIAMMVISMQFWPFKNSQRWGNFFNGVLTAAAYIIINLMIYYQKKKYVNTGIATIDKGEHSLWQFVVRYKLAHVGFVLITLIVASMQFWPFENAHRLGGFLNGMMTAVGYIIINVLIYKFKKDIANVAVAAVNEEAPAASEQALVVNAV